MNLSVDVSVCHALHLMTEKQGPLTAAYFLIQFFVGGYDKCSLAFILKLKHPALTCWPLLPNQVTSYITPAKTAIKLCHTTTIHPSSASEGHKGAGLSQLSLGKVLVHAGQAISSSQGWYRESNKHPQSYSI